MEGRAAEMMLATLPASRRQHDRRRRSARHGLRGPICIRIYVDLRRPIRTGTLAAP